MYNLNKAKEEIDAVARHATDIANHMLALSGDVEARLERMKADILKAIDEKFDDLRRSVHGEEETQGSSAVEDLAAKVSLLMRPGSGSAEEAHHHGGTDPEWSPDAAGSEPHREHEGGEHRPAEHQGGENRDGQHGGDRHHEHHGG